MWHLVRVSLAYHLKTLLVAWCVALGVGLLQILLSWVQSEPGEFDPGHWLVIPMLGFAATAIASIVAFETEDRERRLLLHLPLPVTRAQVGLARVVFPAMIIVLGTAATALLSGAILLGIGTRPTADAAGQLLFATIVAMFFLQLLLAVLSLVRGGHRPRKLMGIVTLLMLLGVTLVTSIELAQFGSHLVVALGIAGLTLGLMGLSLYFFQRRPSFTTG
jgi:hypothetical protein